MKTAISIPDKTFAAAEEFAKARGMSRSELFRLALEAYLKRHSDEAISDQLNEVYATEESALDPFLKALRASGLKHADGDFEETRFQTEAPRRASKHDRKR